MLGHHMGGLSYYSRFMDQLVISNADLIILHLFGHSHTDYINLVSRLLAIICSQISTYIFDGNIVQMR